MQAMTPLKLIRPCSRKSAGCRLHWFAALIVTLALQADAATVYKYRNANGAITYSDNPPLHTDDYEIIELQSQQPGDPEAHRQMLDQMTATSDRLQADRRQREKDRQDSAPSRASPPPYYPQTGEPQTSYYPGYPYYHRPYHRNPRPPLRNDREIIDSGNPLDRLRTPLKIPSFNRGENFRERHNIEP
ncbi:MAG: DUF4124 domain-containing protein [Porticoccaceae bacterium]